MPLDLPADSLGPKPTKKQMDLLKRMATPGATVHTWEGTSLGSGGAYIKYDVPGEHKTDRTTKSDVLKFYNWGWLELRKRGFPGCDYVTTDRARKVIEKGETR